VFGEFKRGKSTLLNALLGVTVLPMGVVPVTAVVTEVRAGQPAVIVYHEDGTVEQAELSALGRYVTEAGNPGNGRHVVRVEVLYPGAWLRSGLVLVDTPGFGSVHGHDPQAEWQLGRSDGAIVVLSADAPFSRRDAEVLRSADQHSGRLFVVVNRVDNLGPGEREQVGDYIRAQVVATLGRGEPVWMVSARDALAAKQSGDPSLLEDSEWTKFEAAVRDFTMRDLAGAQLVATGRRLDVIAASLETSVLVEADALRHDAEHIGLLVGELERLATEQRQAFDVEVSLLIRDERQLAVDVAERLQQRSREATPAAVTRLRDLVRDLSTRSLESEMDGCVERVVRETFDDVNKSVAQDASRAWDERVRRFRDRIRVEQEAGRSRAVEILAFPLPVWANVELDNEPDRFTYLFLHVGSTTEYLNALGRRLLPSRVRRSRVVKAAEERIASELDKHAGRARADFAQRLQDSVDRLVRLTRPQVEAHTGALLAALERARTEREHDEPRRRQRQEELQQQRARLREIRGELSSIALTTPVRGS